MKILLSILSAFLFSSSVKSQNANQGDTSLVFSITIFNKADNKNQTRFPDVYPNINSIKLISNTDTILCTYDFPFLTLSKQGFLNLANEKNLELSFNYDYITAKFNSRFFIYVPIKFPLTYKGAKFIVIEQDTKNRFYGMQQWGSTFYKGGQLKSKLIY